jgi:nicotinamidase-related amidase
VLNAPWALLIVDMQNDFVLPGAVLCVAGAQATIPVIAQAADWFRARGWPVVYVVREHAADGSDVERPRLGLFQRHPFLVPGTPGCEIVSGLEPRPGDLRIVKKRWSAFMHTELDWVLRRLGIERIAVSGTQIPNCLRATLLDALCYGYEAVLLTDASSAQTPEVARYNRDDLCQIGVECLSMHAFAAARDAEA